jgi:hypothetical protein
LPTAQCGSTVNTLYATVTATYISGAQGYRFEVTNMTTNAVVYIDRLQNSFSFSSLSGITLNTQYQIRVALKINGVWQPHYGAACFVNTPNPAATITSCGSTLAAMSQWIYCTSVANAAGYRFKVVNLLNSTVQTTDQTLNKFNFTQLASRTYNTPYRIEVAVKNTDGTYLAFTPAPAGCFVTTPAFPSTQLRPSQCGDVSTGSSYAVLSNGEMLAADNVPTATQYRFRVYNTGLGYDFSVDRSLNTFNLNMFPGLLPGTEYNVNVMVYIGGEWGPEGKTCSITTPGGAKATAQHEVTSFSAVAYPNPYTNAFGIKVSTNEETSISVRVYDMIGKLVEQRTVQAIDIDTIELGSTYPTGVYNVIVSQGEANQTLRVIKR